MPVLESVLSDEFGRDKRELNMEKAFKKPSVLRTPLTACPDFNVPFHWMDGGNILDYPTTIETYVSSNGFSNLTTLVDGSVGVGFYIVENETLGIVSALPFVNNTLLNFCVNYEKSFEYDNFIVFTDYSVKKGMLPFVNGLIGDLKGTLDNLISSPAWGYLNPDQQGTIEFLRDAVVSSNSAFDMTQIPPPIQNLPKFSGMNPSDFYVTSTSLVPAPNAQVLPYIGLQASACPSLRHIFSDQPITQIVTSAEWSNISTGPGSYPSSMPIRGSAYAVYSVDMGNNPETTNTMAYYTNEIEEATGGGMSSKSKGIWGHIQDLLSALPLILAGIMAANGLLALLESAGGACAAFAQALGSVLGVINGIIGAIAAVIQEIMNFVNTLIQEVMDLVNRLTQAIIDGIASVISAIQEQITKIVDSVMNAVSELIGQAMKLAQQVFSKIMDEIKKIVEFFKNMISEALSSIFGDSDSCLVALVKQIANPAANAAMDQNVEIANLGIS